MNRYTCRPSFGACLAACALLILGGCAQLSLGTVWALKDLDYLTLDSRVVRLALGLPQGARLDEATLTMQFARSDEVEISHKIDFDIITSGPELGRAGLQQDALELIVLRVPASRVADVTRFQQVVLKERENPRGSSMTVGIGSRLDQKWLAEHCATTRQPIRVSAWLLVNEEQGYLPLFADSQLSKLLNSQASGLCQ